MSPKLLATAALGAIALVAAPLSAEAGGKKERRYEDRPIARDCRPINGPFGYYGNPWCDGGYKYAEDYPPGTGDFFDVFDLPQVRRLGRRFE